MAGPELWDDTPEFSAGGHWTDNGGGSYSYIGDGTNNQMKEENLLEVDVEYTITFDVTNYVDQSGGATMSVNRAGGAILIFSSNGTKSVTFTAAAVQVRFSRQSGTVDCDIANISVKSTVASAATATLTGTATSSITEADIVTGGDTIIIQLTGDTFLAAGTAFDDQRQAIIDGLNGV